MNSLEQNSPDLYNWIDSTYNKQFNTSNIINNRPIPEATIEGGADYQNNFKELEADLKTIVSELEDAVTSSEYNKIKKDLIPKLKAKKKELEVKCTEEKEKFRKQKESIKTGGSIESCCEEYQNKKEEIINNMPLLYDCKQGLFDVSSFNTRLNNIKKKYKYTQHEDIMDIIDDLDTKITYLENQINTKYKEDYKVVNDKLDALFNYSLHACKSCNQQNKPNLTNQCIKHPPVFNCPPI